MTWSVNGVISHRGPFTLEAHRWPFCGNGIGDMEGGDWWATLPAGIALIVNDLAAAAGTHNSTRTARRTAQNSAEQRKTTRQNHPKVTIIQAVGGGKMHHTTHEGALCKDYLIIFVR